MEHSQRFCCDGWTSSKVTAERHRRTKESRKVGTTVAYAPLGRYDTVHAAKHQQPKPNTTNKTRVRRLQANFRKKGQAYCPPTYYAERERSHSVFAEKQQLLQLAQLNVKTQVLTTPLGSFAPGGTLKMFRDVAPYAPRPIRSLKVPILQRNSAHAGQGLLFILPWVVKTRWRCRVVEDEAFGGAARDLGCKSTVPLAICYWKALRCDL